MLPKSQYVLSQASHKGARYWHRGQMSLHCTEQSCALKGSGFLRSLTSSDECRWCPSSQSDNQNTSWWFPKTSREVALVHMKTNGESHPGTCSKHIGRARRELKKVHLIESGKLGCGLFPSQVSAYDLSFITDKVGGKEKRKRKKKKSPQLSPCKKKNINTRWYTAEWNSYSITVLLSLSVLTEHSGISLPDFE